MNPDPTYPHDYRIIAAGDLRPTIVGGQAVNLWAITFLEEDAADLTTKYASGDLDVLSTPRILEFLQQLGPDWRVDKIPFWSFGDGREAIARGFATDRRKLLVEVLKHVHGLEPQDLKGVEDIDYAGVTFRVLDPVSLLKSKAANVRDLDQIGPPPRHDRAHLELIARCLPLYLRRLHAGALANPTVQSAAARVFSRAFETLLHRPTARTLHEVGIPRVNLMPDEFQQSPIEKIRTAYTWQWPRLQST